MAQINKNSSNSGPKSFDVVAPGKMPAAPSGKPIIVSNRPMIKDPMAPPALKSVSGALHPSVHAGIPATSTLLGPSNGNGDAAQVQAPGAPQLPGRRTMKTISVLNNTGLDEADTAVASEAPAAAAPSEPAPSEAAERPAEGPSASAAPEEPDKAAPSPSAEPTVQPDDAKADTNDDTTDDSTKSDPSSKDVPLADNAKQRAEQERAAREAEEEKIVASRQYYLPIKDVERQRGNNRALLWLVLAVLASLVWFDLVLDAGVIHITGIHALTHFFKG